jgi:hypothetical protein
MSKLRVKENKPDNKIAAFAIVDKAAEAARMKAGTSIFGQDVLYSRKAKEAKHYKSTGEPSELLSVDCRVYGLTLDQAADNIIQKSQTLDRKICSIEEKRLSGKKDIAEEELNAFEIAKAVKKEIENV